MRDLEAHIDLLSVIIRRSPQLPQAGECKSLPLKEVDKLFFGTDENGEDIKGRQRSKHSDEAKKICQQCSVQADCLGHTMEEGVELGVWGGQTQSERKALRKQRRNNPTS